jgi:hypothetical protein
LIGFALEENHIDTNNYVLPALKDQYDVYVGVRQKTATPYDHGEYKLVYGPFRLTNQSPLDQTLTVEEIAQLGTNCIEFTAFAIPRVDGRAIAIMRPFDPVKVGQRISVFNSASVCAQS